MPAVLTAQRPDVMRLTIISTAELNRLPTKLALMVIHQFHFATHRCISHDTGNGLKNALWKSRLVDIVCLLSLATNIARDHPNSTWTSHILLDAKKRQTALKILSRLKEDIPFRITERSGESLQSVIPCSVVAIQGVLCPNLPKLIQKLSGDGRHGWMTLHGFKQSIRIRYWGSAPNPGPRRAGGGNNSPRFAWPLARFIRSIAISTCIRQRKAPILFAFNLI